MNIGIYSIIGGILALISGLVIGYLLNLFLTNKRISSAKNKAENLLVDAKNKAQDIILEAKNNSLKTLEDSKKVEQERHQQLLRIEGMLGKRELELDSRSKEIDVNKKNVAKEILFRNLEDEYRKELADKMRKFEQSNKEELDRKAKEILTTAVQRYAGSHISDATTTVVSLQSDEVKGKIIGKEGRNIKTIERLTG